MTDDITIYEAYANAAAPKKKKPVKVYTENLDGEQLDEAISDIMGYINRLNWDKNPLDPADKKEAIRRAGKLMAHIKEAEKCMEELEELIGSALSPGFNKLVSKIVKDTI